MQALSMKGLSPKLHLFYFTISSDVVSVTIGDCSLVFDYLFGLLIPPFQFWCPSVHVIILLYTVLFLEDAVKGSVVDRVSSSMYIYTGSNPSIQHSFLNLA